MVGANRKYRRPLLIGVARRLRGVGALTWVVAQTVLGSLARYGERLEAVVSVIAIAVLLLILNWFYHRVYWAEHLAGLPPAQAAPAPRRRSRARRRADDRARRARVLERLPRRVRDGSLPAGADARGRSARRPARVCLLGLAATFAVGVVTILLERKLPHRKMLIVTGVLMTWVLVILVGTTVQTLPGRRVAAGGADRRRAAAVLGRDVARHLPDLAGSTRADRCRDASSSAATSRPSTFARDAARRVLSSVRSNSITVESGRGANYHSRGERRLVLIVVLLALALPTAGERGRPHRRATRVLARREAAERARRARDA